MDIVYKDRAIKTLVNPTKGKFSSIPQIYEWEHKNKPVNNLSG